MGSGTASSSQQGQPAWDQGERTPYTRARGHRAAIGAESLGQLSSTFYMCLEVALLQRSDRVRTMALGRGRG